MKKNFLKKLALAMALVVTATSVNVPAASAAEAPGFKSTAVNVKVGQTKKYNTQNTGTSADKAANRYSVSFKIGKTNIATIKYSAGSKAVKVTGVAEGNTTLRADFKNYATKKITPVRIPVTVTAAEEVVTVAELASVKQTAANAFEATFTADASATFTADSFTSIESTDGIYSAYVSSVTFSTDGKSAIVTTYGNFVDGAVYNVTCGDKTASFTASVGKVASAVITTVQAQADVETDIEFKLYDANNIDVTNAVDVNTYVTLDVDGDYTDAELNKPAKATITMGTVGDKATVTLTYDAYDGSAEVKAVGTIVCVSTQATVGKTTVLTLNDEFDGDTPKIYLNSFEADAVLYDEDAASKLYFTALDADGLAIDYEYYEIESANDNVIEVTEDVVSGTYASFNVDPVGTGTAKVIIKATKNDVETVYYGTVTVKAERELKSVVLSTSSLTVSNLARNEVNDNITVMLLDQYGNLMPEADYSLSAYDTDENDEVSLASAATYDGFCYDTLKLDATGIDKDSYTLVINADDGDNDVTKKFTVKVNTATTTVDTKYTYKAELNKTSMDLNPESRYNSNTSGTITARLAKYVGSVFAGYETIENAYVSKSSKYFTNGNLYADSSLSKTATPIAVSGESFFLTTVNAPATSGAIKLTADDAFDGIAETGTYQVKLVINDGLDNEIAKSATLTVKNTMEMPSVTIDATKGEGTGKALVADCVTVDVDVLADEDASIEEIYDADMAVVTATGTNNDKYVVRYIEVKDTFGSYEYHYFVPVSKTFTTED